MEKQFRAAKGDGVKGGKSWGVIRDTTLSADWVLNPCFTRTEALDAANRENSRAALIAKYGTDDFLEIAKIIGRSSK